MKEELAQVIRNEKEYQEMITTAYKKIEELDSLIEEQEAMIEGQEEAIKALRDQILKTKESQELIEQRLIRSQSDKKQLAERLEQTSRGYSWRLEQEANQIRKEERRKRRFMGTAWWAVLLLQAAKSEKVREDILEIYRLLKGAIIQLLRWEQTLFRLMDQSRNFHSETPAIVSQWITTSLVTGIIVSITGLMAKKGVVQLLRQYKIRFWDEITRTVWYLSCAMAILYAENLRIESVPNILGLIVIVHGVYLLIRAVIRKRWMRRW